MGYVNVFVSSPCNLSVKNRQLIVKGQEEHSFPLEDMNALLIESAECNVSGYALQALADAGVVVFTCDSRHLPNGVLTPYNCYYRQLKILNLQLNISKPLQKQLWQTIIRRKIENQALCVRMCSDESNNDLLTLAKSVSSDDSGNCEATAANIYFKKIFGKGFVRRDDSFVNAALNYGYSLIRGLIARTLAVYGFESSLGIHHSNELNAFNLADDLIEPFRPVVDMLVFNMSGSETLSANDKKRLFSLLNQDVQINGGIYSLSYAVEITVQSLKNSMAEGKNILQLPEILPISMHRYE